MRQGGVTVDEKPKIHCPDPTSNNHCISFQDNDMWISLQLNGIFSFFHTKTPTEDELLGCDRLFISPDESQWNPYCSSFELNERSILNYEGEITASSQREAINMKLDANPI